MSISSNASISPSLVLSGNGGDVASESYNPSAASQQNANQVGVAGASSYIAPVLTATNSTINYTSNQESPQAIAALQSTVGTALNTMSTDSLASILASKSIADKALDTSLQALQSPLQQAAKGIVIPLVIGIAVIAVIYYWKGRS